MQAVTGVTVSADKQRVNTRHATTRTQGVWDAITARRAKNKGGTITREAFAETRQAHTTCGSGHSLNPHRDHCYRQDCILGMQQQQQQSHTHRHAGAPAKGRMHHTHHRSVHTSWQSLAMTSSCRKAARCAQHQPANECVPYTPSPWSQGRRGAKTTNKHTRALRIAAAHT